MAVVDGITVTKYITPVLCHFSKSSHLH